MLAYSNKEMVRASYYYYKLGMTQEDIAKKMNTSRQRINRIIKSALDQGIVKIDIVDRYKGNIELEERLERKFNLQQAIVISAMKERLITNLGQAGASYLESIIKKDDIIGFTGGNTISEVAKNLSHNEDLNISAVQLVGGMNIAFTNMSPEEITRTIAKKLGGKAYIPYAPVIVENEETKKALMADHSLSSIFDYMKKAKIFMVGIGELNENTKLYIEDEFNKQYTEHLLSHGGVGDIGFRWFNRNGQPIENQYNTRTIGFDVLKDREDTRVIGISGGQNKIEAIRGALAGSYIDVLITDIDVAEELLDD